MQTQNGQCTELNEHSVSTADDTRNVSTVNVSMTQAQADFFDLIFFHGISELATSLRMMHDLALYHSDVPFDRTEKNALFDLKLLWEGFESMAPKES